MTGRLAGRRALVTGGATGIGAAISRTLLDEGAVVAVVQRSPAELEAALLESGMAGLVTGIAADLSVGAQCRQAIDEAAAELGGIDALVNNAAVTGPPARRAVLDIDDAHVDAVVDLNLKGVVHCSAQAARHMTAAGGGVIVSIASVLAHVPQSQGALYTATKAGVLALTKAMALELGPAGIRVATVSPGDIDTASSLPPLPAGDPGRAVRVPALGRRGGPAEIAAVVAFLLTDEASYLTGTDVLVDGGFLLT